MQDRPKTTPDLFTPIALGPLTLPNRIAMAPLTRSRAAAGNVPTQLNALLLCAARERRADHLGSDASGARGPGLYLDARHPQRRAVQGWRCVTGAVHVAGGRIVLQLWHVGRISHQSFQPGGALPVAPSAIRPNGQAYTAKGFEPIPTPRALDIAEIPGIVAQYAQGARNAMAAGFDGVEVHGANGYLIDQFLRDGTNKRTDAYGGSIENRMRFLLEVVDAVIAVVGAERTGLRISPQNGQNDIADSDPQRLFNHVASALSGKGLAYLHVIEGDTGGTPVPPFDYGEIKRRFGGIVIANNGFDKERANEAIAQGRADLVAFGKPFIGNPDLVTRLYLDAPLNPANRETFYGGADQGYTDYPMLRGVEPHACYCDGERAWG